MFPVRKPITYAVAAVLAAFALSWVAGQCREWGKPKVPKAPKPIPGYVDQGTPSPGPVNEAPTVQVRPEIAVPKLTRTELEAEAAKLGFKLTPKGQNPPQNGPSGARIASGAGPSSSKTEIVPPAGSSGFVQQLFAKEHFGKGPAGDGITVWAWQMEEGGRMKLLGAWDDFQPPPPPAPPGPGFFENVAKFHWTLGAGGVGTEDGFGPGGLLGFGYGGWRTGHATWGIDLFGIGGQVDGEVTGSGFLGMTVRIE